jgi:hypothetical protein
MGMARRDILFQDASRALAVSELNGTVIAGGGQIRNPGAAWRVLG